MAAITTDRGLHVAIIMDGNGRWAAARGLPRLAGHRQGAEAVRRTVEAAPGLGVRVLTLYAFSADNWKRPASEVTGLMRMFEEFLGAEALRCADEGVRLTIIGRRDRLSPPLRDRIAVAEMSLGSDVRLDLRLAVDYSARDAIWQAALRVRRDTTREEFSEAIRSGRGERAGTPDVDLLIRTGGEQRLSDFLLWEAAYAELRFTAKAWPDFDGADLAEAIRDFHGRDRRFGGLRSASGLA
jgi:undecaprenyl diphosphate synthase